MSGELFIRKSYETDKLITLLKRKNVTFTPIVLERTYEEAKQIIEYVQNKEIKVAANMFKRTYEEVKEIVRICEDNNLEITGSYFQRKPAELQDIIDYCTDTKKEINPSMLFRTYDEIEKIDELCRDKNIKLYPTMYKRSPEEVENIIDLAASHGLEVKGSFFRKNDDKFVKIIEKCDELGLKPSGSIFKRTPKEIEDIYNIYKDLLDRNPDQNAYNKKPQEVLKILKLCIKNNIKITGTLYRKTSEELESTINYIKQYYSDEYLTPQIIIYDKNHIEKIFNYLSGKKILHTIIKSSGILRLTLEELIDREIYIRMINQDLVVGETFNPVMGWSKKEYEKRKKELNKNK